MFPAGCAQRGARKSLARGAAAVQRLGIRVIWRTTWTRVVPTPETNSGGQRCSTSLAPLRSFSAQRGMWAAGAARACIRSREPRGRVAPRHRRASAVRHTRSVAGVRACAGDTLVRGGQRRAHGAARTCAVSHTPNVEAQARAAAGKKAPRRRASGARPGIAFFCCHTACWCLMRGAKAAQQHATQPWRGRAPSACSHAASGAPRQRRNPTLCTHLSSAVAALAATWRPPCSRDLLLPRPAGTRARLQVAARRLQQQRRTSAGATGGVVIMQRRHTVVALVAVLRLCHARAYFTATMTCSSRTGWAGAHNPRACCYFTNFASHAPRGADSPPSGMQSAPSGR